MFENLNQPYPFNNNFKHNLKTIGLVGMAFVLFLLYFQPFGINFLKSSNDGYFALAAGVACSVTLFANSLLLPGLMPKVFASANWTIRKELLWNLWLFSNLFVIFAVMAALVSKNNYTDLPIYRTAALALLPLVLFNIINYNHSLKDKMVSVIENSRKHWFKEEHHEISAPQDEVCSLTDGGKELITFRWEQLLVIHSSGNYVELYLLDHGIKRKKLIRLTFATVENILKKQGNLLKSHRCWLVNISKIERIGGNSKGYFIEVPKLGFPVPISRNFVGQFRELMPLKFD